MQTDHPDYREVGPADLPGVRLLVDGRRVTDAGRWAGTPRIVVGVGDAVSIDDDVADDDAGNAAGVGEA